MRSRLGIGQPFDGSARGGVALAIAHEPACQ
jgi:hypothetical protein